MSEGKPATTAKKGGKKKLLIPLLAVLVLGGGGAGAWFSGLLPKLLGKGGEPAAAADTAKPAHGEAAKPAHGEAAKPAHGAEAKPAENKGGHGAEAKGGHGDKPDAKTDNSPFMELPDIVSNLNNGAGRRATFLKLKAKLELAKPEDQATLQAAMPRVLDLFQGYLREMRPEELRGTAGTYRLREELLARTNLAVPGVRVVAVLFTEILVQ